MSSPPPPPPPQIFKQNLADLFGITMKDHLMKDHITADFNIQALKLNFHRKKS